ncbi:hypothetical protein [Oceanobacillus polygoni]|uniref:Ethanolamine utilization protein EutQ (Cupin superfamily) n=1 Tax=Oceanobacillus polygoni TaxID=1235259 RepID=A0A9X1CGU0_9BACI|nr:hypothetical protein [Oceanobacillus polygoni]MBP2078460.1 ethanolamine utilization protein EutQ (cupin superfamily) [Oceanobacillus polygoni]
MSSRTATKDNYTYLSQKPGLQLIKDGSYEKKELNAELGIPEVRSQIIEAPLTTNNDAVTLGFFSMQKASKGFEFEYDFLELKTVVRGKFVLSDNYGNSFVATEGDVVIINPGTVVNFSGESDGEAVYVAHRLPEPAFN